MVVEQYTDLYKNIVIEGIHKLRHVLTKRG